MAFVFWSTYFRAMHPTDARLVIKAMCLYTISYRMCSNAGLYDHSKALYDRTKDEIEHVLQHYVVPELNKNKYADEGNAILNKFSHHWENHKVFVK